MWSISNIWTSNKQELQSGVKDAVWKCYSPDCHKLYNLKFKISSGYWSFFKSISVIANVFKITSEVYFVRNWNISSCTCLASLILQHLCYIQRRNHRFLQEPLFSVSWTLKISVAKLVFSRAVSLLVSAVPLLNIWLSFFGLMFCSDKTVTASQYVTGKPRLLLW